MGDAKVIAVAGLRTQPAGRKLAACLAAKPLLGPLPDGDVSGTSALCMEGGFDPAELARMLLDTSDENSVDLLDPAAVPAYVDKIVRAATVLSIRSGDVLQAFLAFYCNDPQRRIAYMSMLMVHRQYRRMGLAELLVQESVHRLVRLGFDRYRLEVHKNNLPAIQLYERVGFHRTGEEGACSLFMEMPLGPIGPAPMNSL